MSPDTLKRAGMALVALLVLWSAFALLRGSLGEDVERLTLPRLTAADINRIEVTGPAETLQVAKTGTDRWAVNGLPAAPSAVEEVFTALADSGLSGELVARSSASHERMEVDSARGRRVRFLKGDSALADLIVGGRGQSFESAYIRPGGSDDVYLVTGRLTNLLTRDLDAWRDKRIGGEPADSIGGLEVERRGSRYTLQRRDTTWTINGAPADQAAVTTLLGAYADITASGFPTQAQLDSIRFARPYRRVRVLSRSGAPILSIMFDSTASGVWARGDEGEVVYRVDTWTVDQLAPADSTLRRK